MKLAEFTNPLIPLEEIQDFYSLQNVTIPNNRPFTWSNSLTSIDGILHFLEDSQNVGEIGLKHIRDIDPHQEADWRLLNSSRMYADAVLLTGQIIRDEADVECSIKYQDLIEFRKSLRKTTEHPIQCILSDTGDFPLDRPIFHLESQIVWIFTSLTGKERIETEIRKSTSTTWSNISIFSFSTNNHVSEMLEIMRKKGVMYCDVSCGGKVIRSFLDQQLLDEVRMTTAGHIIGPFNSKGIARPKLYPVESVASYNPSNAPLISWKGIRTSGEYFVFYRGTVKYRTSC